MEALRQERSLTQLLKDLTSDISTLLRQEVSLAKAETAETLSKLASRMAEMAVGGVIALAGALALVAALCVGLATLLSRWMSPELADWLGPAIVGVALAAMGYVLVRQSIRNLKQDSLVPRKTTQSLQENKQWLQAKIH